jgi:hypothetical protein
MRYGVDALQWDRRTVGGSHYVHLYTGAVIDRESIPPRKRSYWILRPDGRAHRDTVEMTFSTLAAAQTYYARYLREVA